MLERRVSLSAISCPPVKRWPALKSKCSAQIYIAYKSCNLEERRIIDNKRLERFDIILQVPFVMYFKKTLESQKTKDVTCLLVEVAAESGLKSTL